MPQRASKRNNNEIYGFGKHGGYCTELDKSNVAMRSCLKCGIKFRSESKAHRKCGKCGLALERKGMDAKMVEGNNL